MSENLLDQLENAESNTQIGWLITQSLLQSLPTEVAESVLAAAIPHWFDGNILGALLEVENDEAQTRYMQLKRLQITEPIGEYGYALHDLTRSSILTHLVNSKSSSFFQWSERAYKYFSKNSNIKDQSEALYHKLALDGNSQLQIFKEQIREYRNKEDFASAHTLLRTARELVVIGRLDKSAEDELERQEFQIGRLLGDRITRTTNIQDAKADIEQFIAIFSPANFNYSSLKDDPDSQKAYFIDLQVDYLRKRLDDASIQNDSNLQTFWLTEFADFDSSQKNYKAAIEKLDMVLSLQAKTDDTNGKASTLNSLARLYVQTGETKRALPLWQEAIILSEQAGDMQGKAAILYKMAGIIAQQGDPQRALSLLQEALTNYKQTKDSKGEAAAISLIAHLTAQQGDVPRALELWQQALGLVEQIYDVHSKAGILHNMALVLAGGGQLQKAIDLWQQSLAIKQQIGDITGKANTLSMLANVYARQGDTDKALELWNDSLAVYEQLEDVHGRATVLSMMAGEIATHGDSKRAFELWNESLKLKEQIGDVRGCAATLSKMAKVTTEQGDYVQARTWWEQALSLVEQVGDAFGRAATLANLALLAQQQDNPSEAYKLNLEAATAFAALEAWPDLVTVLDNLGNTTTDQSIKFYAQAYWLALHVAVPIEQSLSLAAKLSGYVEHHIAPLLAVSASHLVNRMGDDNPKRDALVQVCVDLLVTSADIMGVSEDNFGQWFADQGLDRSNYVIPTLKQYLSLTIGDDWLFDREEVLKFSKITIGQS